jgi:hypothetical protein
MLDASVKIDRGLLRLGKLPDEVRAALKTEANELATKLRDNAKSKFGQFFTARSGAYLKSIKKSVRTSKTGVTGKVYSKDPTAHFLEKGTRPHEITIRNAKALAFIGSGGAQVDVASVQHPGMKGHTIINSAFAEMKPEIREGLAKAVSAGTLAADAAAGA